MKYNVITFKTKFGWISAFEQSRKIHQIKFKKTKKYNTSTILKKFKLNFYKFYSHKIKTINSPYKMIGSKIQKKIWGEIKKIHYGKTKTYGEIAKKLNTSPRLVGKICGQNKLLLIIPCHRVVKTNGGLGGFSAKGGIKLKKRLIDFENKF